MSVLNDKRIVVTRSAAQAEPLTKKLQDLGATVLLYPCIAIIPTRDRTRLENCVSQMLAGKFDWLIFTSTNAVDAVANFLAQKAMPRSVRIAAVGPATALAIEKTLGVPAQVIPEEHYNAETLAATVKIKEGERVLLPQSELSDQSLCAKLREKGAIVENVVAYSIEVGEGGVDLPQMLTAGDVDALTFASASSVENFLTRIKNENKNISEAEIFYKNFNLPAFCIGDKTASAARGRGFKNIHAAATQTIDSLVSTLETYFAGKQ